MYSMVNFWPKERLGACLRILAALLLARGAAWATVTNGDFSGGLSGWSTIGSVAVATSFTYPAPQGGTILPQAGTQVTELETTAGSRRRNVARFLGVSSRSLNAIIPETVTEGSAMRQTFTGSDFVSFDWNLWTRDYPPYNDVAFVALSGPGISGTQLIVLDSVNSFAAGSSSGDNGPANGTGWQNTTLALPGSGSYSIGFGVMNASDDNVSTYLHIDNVTTAPEPSTALGVLVSLLAIAYFPFHRGRTRRLQSKVREPPGPTDG